MYKYGAVLVLSVSLVLASTGCATKHNNNVKTNNYKAHSTEKRSIMNGTSPMDGTRHTVDGTRHNVDGSHPMNKSTHQSANLTVSEKIAKHVSAVSGVDKATVILNNRDAVVGIDLKSGANKAAVEQKVMQAVKRVEPNYAVHVTTDKKLHTRIRSLHGQMVPLDGHPIRNLSEDVGTLIRDMGRTITAPLR